MLNSFALLFIGNNYFQDEKQQKACEFLVYQLSLLNYAVEKVSYVNQHENVLKNELRFLSKEYDFLIVIDTENQTNLILKSLNDICNKGILFSNNCSNCSHNSEYPLLVRSLRLKEINSFNHNLYYFQRIFILKLDIVEDLFMQLLKEHLEQYKKRVHFKKKFKVQLNESNENHSEIFNKFLIFNGRKDHEFVTIQLEKTIFENFVEDEMALKKQFKENVIEICDRDYVWDTIHKSEENHLSEAIKSIEKCWETYGIENVFLTFNGGKDCTVLLHLINLVKCIKYPMYQKPIFCLYVRDEDTFAEQDKFVAQCQVYYNLDILSLSLGMKEALNEFLEKKTNMKGCFLGTRRTDPYSSGLNTFQMTDPSWPPVMRISPLLEWHYSDIWNYILFYKVPYCSLYDQGYTSLGSASCTARNPSLLHYSVKLDKEIYLPAYKLLNEAEERSGRSVMKT